MKTFKITMQEDAWGGDMFAPHLTYKVEADFFEVQTGVAIFFRYANMAEIIGHKTEMVIAAFNDFQSIREITEIE